MVRVAATWKLGRDVGYGFGWRFQAGSLTPFTGKTPRKRRRTTPIVRTEPQKFRITHPFHPLSGREFELLWCKDHPAARRVCFLDKKGRRCEIPLSWTDLAPEDPFLALSSGRNWFRVADLLELACLIEGLRHDV